MVAIPDHPFVVDLHAEAADLLVRPLSRVRAVRTQRVLVAELDGLDLDALLGEDLPDVDRHQTKTLADLILALAASVLPSFTPGRSFIHRSWFNQVVAIAMNSAFLGSSATLRFIRSA